MKRSTVIIKAIACVALSMASVPAMANPACSLSIQGCVLPVQDVAAAPTTQVTPAPMIMSEEPKSFGILPILAGLAVLGALAYFLILEDDNDAELLSP